METFMEQDLRLAGRKTKPIADLWPRTLKERHSEETNPICTGRYEYKPVEAQALWQYAERRTDENKANRSRLRTVYLALGVNEFAGC